MSVSLFTIDRYFIFSGDLTVVKRHWLAGQEMSGKDYDQRTALHLGKLVLITFYTLFYISLCKVYV